MSLYALEIGMFIIVFALLYIILEQTGVFNEDFKLKDFFKKVALVKSCF